MKGKSIRSKAREKAFQMFYYYKMTNLTYPEVIEQFWLLNEENDRIKKLANEFFKMAVENEGFADDIISKYLKDGWTFDRLTEPVKNVLRVGIAELFKGDAPGYAVLDEYTTLARKFEDEKAASFVNGVLDRIKKDFNIER